MIALHLATDSMKKEQGLASEGPVTSPVMCVCLSVSKSKCALRQCDSGSTGAVAMKGKDLNSGKCMARRWESWG